TPVMKYTKKKIIISIVSVLLLIMAMCFINLSNSISEYYSTNWVSKSINDSKLNGAFVRELSIKPNGIKQDSLSVEFNECWIEQQTKLKYSWLFFSEYYGTGKYRLCFNLKNKFHGKNTLSHFFVEQNGQSFTQNSSGENEVFNIFVEKEATGQIKVSLVKSWKEPRDKYVVINLR
ncbi:hypothetical protein, partial [Flavobacterium sp.]|uniref:hypothetical protein n=1 Tax=Flavobacterium sp. TaxID=239 RepID=UPI00391CDBCC